MGDEANGVRSLRRVDPVFNRLHMSRYASALLRRALNNLAALPEVQEQRLAGTVVRDELARDFTNAHEASRGTWMNRADAARANLDRIYRKLSAPAEDPLWIEDPTRARWSCLRVLASQTEQLLPAGV